MHHSFEHRHCLPTLTKAKILTLALALLAACSPSTTSRSLESGENSKTGSSAPVTVAVSEMPLADRLSLDLTALGLGSGESYAQGVESAIVQMTSIEAEIRDGETTRWVTLTSTPSALDLMDLNQNAAKLATSTLDDDVVLLQLRMVLADTGNRLELTGGSSCELKTPSAQTSGLKLLLEEPETIARDREYSILLEFDVQHSLVFQGNGGCLLRPVVRTSISSQPVATPTPSPTPDPTVTPTATPSPTPLPPPADDP